MVKRFWLVIMMLLPRRTVIIALLIILLTGLGVKAAEKNYLYHSTTKDVVVTLEEKVLVREDEITDTMLSDNGEVTETVLAPDWATKRWELHNREEDTNLVAKRSGDLIIVQGRFKGKEVAKKIKIDGRPWFQAWNLSFGPFVLSGEGKREFWAIQDSDLKEFVMVVLREKEEALELNDEAVEAVKFKVTLNNWMSIFWSCNYWFRKSDGVFLRSEGANGPPGTPVTVMEMINEW